MTVQFEYDESVDALYIRLREGGAVVRTAQLDRGTLVDVDEFGRAVGVEIVSPARDWPLDDLLQGYSIEPEAEQVLVAFWRRPERFPFVAPLKAAASG